MLDIAPGTVFGGRFTLLNLLARGERGNVWHSRDDQTGREVALRILDPASSSSREQWLRLERAYAIAARLDHPNVLRVGAALRLGHQVAQPMELAAKGDAESLRGAPLYAIVPVLIDIAAALAFAHARGVHHLDLQLDRILIAADGSARLASFGRDAPSEESSAEDGERIDVATFGQLAYQLLVQVPGGQRWLPQRLEALLAEVLNRDATVPLPPMAEIVDELRESLRDTTPLSDYILPRPTTANASSGAQSPAVPSAPIAHAESMQTMVLDDDDDEDDVIEFFPDLRQLTVPDYVQPEGPSAEAEAASPIAMPAAEIAKPAFTKTSPARAKAVLPWGRLAAGVALAVTMLAGWRGLAPPMKPERSASQAPTAAARPKSPAVALAAPTALASEPTTSEPVTVDPVDAAKEAAARSVRSALRAGDWALESFDGEAASRAFRKVLSIDPENAAARSGLASVSRLPGLKLLIQDARAAEQRGDLGRALKGYSQALANDRTSRLLRASVERLRKEIGLDAFGKAMGDGYVAIGAGKLDRANEAFSKALQLRPTADAALAAVAEVEAALAARAAAADAANERSGERTSARL